MSTVIVSIDTPQSLLKLCWGKQMHFLEISNKLEGNIKEDIVPKDEKIQLQKAQMLARIGTSPNS